VAGWYASTLREDAMNTTGKVGSGDSVGQIGTRDASAPMSAEQLDKLKKQMEQGALTPEKTEKFKQLVARAGRKQQTGKGQRSAHVDGELKSWLSDDEEKDELVDRAESFKELMEEELNEK
jgi:hypothetical protein